MRTDPYEVLGIASTASLEEAEDAYYALMRREHPDLHHGAGAERLAEAERRTRELTSAIAAIRSGRAVRSDVGGPTAGSPPPRGPADATSGPGADDDRASDAPGGAWTGSAGGSGCPPWGSEPEPEPATAACPWCGQRYARAVDLKDHVFDEHDLRLDPRERRGLFRGRLGRFTRKASHLPLWGVVPVNLALATVVGIGVAALTDETIGTWAAAITLTPTVAAFLDRLFDWPS